MGASQQSTLTCNRVSDDFVPSCVKVRAKAYRIWLEAIVECAPGDYKVVLNPLTNRSIMSIVVVFGLNDPRQRTMFHRFSFMVAGIAPFGFMSMSGYHGSNATRRTARLAR